MDPLPTDRWLLLGVRHPRSVAAVVALLSLAAAGIVARGVRTDNGWLAWLPPGDARLDEYRAFRVCFGEDGGFVVATGELAGAETDARSALRDLGSSLGALEGVATVVGPLARGPVDAASTLAWLVVPDDALDGPGRGALLDRLRARLARTPVGRPYAIGGPEAINQALDRGATATLRRLLPGVLLVTAAVLWAALGSLRWVLLVLLLGGLTTLWTLALLVLADRTLNLVLVALPPLMLVLTTAYALHLLTVYVATPGADPARRWAAALSELRRPCLLTMATTSAGFAALLAASLNPIRDLGGLAAAGVVIACLLCLLALPALVLLTGDPVPVRPRQPAPVGALRRWRHPVLLAAALAAILASVGIARVRVESRVLRFFAPDHPVRRDSAWIERRLFGLTPIELWIRSPAAALARPAALARLTTLVGACRAEPGVDGLIGPPGLEALSRLPPEQAAGLLRLALAAPAARHDPRWLRVRQGTVDLRLRLSVATTANARFGRLLGRIRGHAARATGEGLTVQVTGVVPVLARIQDLLLWTQLRTFGLSLLLVSGLLLLALRSAHLAALSLVPNLLPVLGTLGLMGWLGIPLDVATVTVAGIAFGLVVDDTIHLLSGYQRARATGLGRGLAISAALATTGRAIRSTSLALALGFAVFALSPFRPTRDFGLLIAATALLALACDLWLLPALMGLGLPGETAGTREGDAG